MDFIINNTISAEEQEEQNEWNKIHAYMLQALIYSIADSMYFNQETRNKIYEFTESLNEDIGTEPLTVITKYPDE